MRQLLGTEAPLNNEYHSNNESCSIPPPPADLANLDLDSVNILIADPDTLLSVSFYQRDVDDAVAGFWRVDAINQTRTRHGVLVEFKVVFEGKKERGFELHLKALIDLMLNSCVCANNYTASPSSVEARHP
jgi:hypothetical protein